ncbi:MAG: hypothetical protein HY042_12160 [Spirochaetia bacterium]|nr:hypothetical protein [Spirochaetia bacterium]
MGFFNRIWHTLRSDVGALIPGTGIHWNRNAFLRTLLYASLIVFVVRIALLALEIRAARQMDQRRNIPSLENRDSKGAEDKGVPEKNPDTIGPDISHPQNI